MRWWRSRRRRTKRDRCICGGTGGHVPGNLDTNPSSSAAAAGARTHPPHT